MQHKFVTRERSPNTFVTVERLKELFNVQLMQSHISQEAKEAICKVLETAIRECNQAVKFEYVYWESCGKEEWLLAGGDDWQKKHFMTGEGEPGMGEFTRVYL